MSQIEYIDLSESDGKDCEIVPSEKFNEPEPKNVKCLMRPKSTALQCMGLSLLKMHFGDKLPWNTNSIKATSGIIRQISIKGDQLYSLWIDDTNPQYRQYPLRHLLEHKFEKPFKCPHNRSNFCQYQSKMTRINWIYHVRRGHIRMDSEFRKTLKKNPQNGFGAIFDVYCVLCAKNRNFLAISPTDFIHHMKKVHSNFQAYTEYFSYFQRCNVCNDVTSSFAQNVVHRQMCMAAIHNEQDPSRTMKFNQCFSTLKNRNIISLQMDNNTTQSVQFKMKSFVSIKRTTIYFWLSRKRMIQSRNGQVIKCCSTAPVSAPTNANKPHVHISQFESPTPTETQIVFTESERVAPGTVLDFRSNNEKFFLAIPFTLTSDNHMRDSYNEWNKMIRPRHWKLAKVQPWYCELCNAMVKNTNASYAHLKMCHSEVRIEENHCKSCNKRFFTVHGYRKHFQDFKSCPVARKCAFCNISVPVLDIYNHLFEMHRNNFAKVLQLETCLICRLNITDIKTHLTTVHGIIGSYDLPSQIGQHDNYRYGSFYNCCKCSMTFLSEIELRNHMIVNRHHFECERCPNIKFYSSWHIDNHNYTVHRNDLENANLICEICSQDSAQLSIESLQFSTLKEKINHIRKLHDSNCFVVLTKLEN